MNPSLVSSTVLQFLAFKRSEFCKQRIAVSVSMYSHDVLRVSTLVFSGNPLNQRVSIHHLDVVFLSVSRHP